MKILTPQEVYKQLDDIVEGQEKAKKVLSNAYFMHCTRSQMHLGIQSDKPLNKTNVLLTGSTGCGKTYLVDTLARITGLPVLKVSAKNLSNTGYVGKDIETFLRQYVKANQSHEDLPYGICFIDEVDKICTENKASSTWNDSIQHTLLTFVEGHYYSFERRSPEDAALPAGFDTSRLFLVMAGSFSIYEEQLKGTKKQIGFNGKDAEADTIEDSPHTHLVAAGMVRELAGRISRVVKLNNLTEENLRNILLTKDNNIYRQYMSIFKFVGKDLRLTKEALDVIISKALKSKTGARGLQSYLEESIEDILFDIELDMRDVDQDLALSRARSILNLPNDEV